MFGPLINQPTQINNAIKFTPSNIMLKNSIISSVTLLFLLIGITACGGGGDDGKPAPQLSLSTKAVSQGEWVSVNTTATNIANPVFSVTVSNESMVVASVAESSPGTVLVTGNMAGSLDVSIDVNSKIVDDALENYLTSGADVNEDGLIEDVLVAIVFFPKV